MSYNSSLTREFRPGKSPSTKIPVTYLTKPIEKSLQRPNAAGFCSLNASRRYYLWLYDAVFIPGLPVGAERTRYTNHHPSILFQEV